MRYSRGCLGLTLATAFCVAAFVCLCCAVVSPWWRISVASTLSDGTISTAEYTVFISEQGVVRCLNGDACLSSPTVDSAKASSVLSNVRGLGYAALTFSGLAYVVSFGGVVWGCVGSRKHVQFAAVFCACFACPLSFVCSVAVYTLFRVEYVSHSFCGGVVSDSDKVSSGGMCPVSSADAVMGTSSTQGAVSSWATTVGMDYCFTGILIQFFSIISSAVAFFSSRRTGVRTVPAPFRTWKML
eukprot:ANDGO_06401.mRNA.1 hypothetical protein